MKDSVEEINFDGLVGPTHQFSGLSFGNIASQKNANQISDPKRAALQGLEKMETLMRQGIPQAVFPPHERPHLQLLRDLGFEGTPEKILTQAHKKIPEIFSAVYSASSMWTANMATVSPSMDTQDQRVHITPANLITQLHRSLEADFNYTLLKAVFSDEMHFSIHKPLYAHSKFSDEGAANHNRLCEGYSSKGVYVFVYGDPSSQKLYPARQSLLASQTISQQHLLNAAQCFFAQQNPRVIDKGVFHNDVISTVNENVWLYHEEAFVHTDKIVKQVQSKLGSNLFLLKVLGSELSVENAVETYLFNSQIITLPDGNMMLLAPMESHEHIGTNQVLNRILAEDNPISTVQFINCRESMQNGGGPACLRLRMTLTAIEKKAMHRGIILDETLLLQLRQWVNKHYRDRLIEQDLLDPLLLQETYQALDELTLLLRLGSIYNFQKI